MILTWVLAFVLIILGFITGYLLPVKIPVIMFPYLTIIFLSLLDSLFYGIRQIIELQPGSWKTIFRLLLEIFLGCFLLFFGDKSGLDLYLVVVIPLGASVFLNFNQLILRKA